jgi:hypothetical protein
MLKNTEMLELKDRPVADLPKKSVGEVSADRGDNSKVCRTQRCPMISRSSATSFWKLTAATASRPPGSWSGRPPRQGAALRFRHPLISYASPLY